MTEADRLKGRPVRLLLFDIDGTLVNALGAGRAALEAAMRSVYGETGPIETFDFHGMTDPAILRKLLAGAGWSQERVARAVGAVWPAYYAELDRELSERDGRVHAYPGVVELLERLRGDRRFAPGLVTGNMEPGAWRKLSACGLDDVFGFGAFGSDSEARDELPPIAARRASTVFGKDFVLGDAMVIGDTPADIRCARVNGIPVLAVATGRHTVAELAAHGPEYLLDDLSDVDRVMRILTDE